MRLPRRATAVGFLLLATTLAAGCGSKSSKSSGSGSSSSQSSSSQSSSSAPPLTAASFDSRLQTALNAGNSTNTGNPQVTSVNCPNNLPAAAGASFTCQVAAQGGLSGTVMVTLNDAQGKSYNYKAVLQGNNETSTISGTGS